MPHAVIEATADLAALRAALPPVRESGPDRVLKTEEAFLNAEGDKLLLEAVAIERGRTQRFYVVIARRREGLSVRIDPMTDPEKSPGVQRLMAEIVRRVLAQLPGARVSRSNLEL